MILKISHKLLSGCKVYEDMSLLEYICKKYSKDTILNNFDIIIKDVSLILLTKGYGYFHNQYEFQKELIKFLENYEN